MKKFLSFLTGIFAVLVTLSGSVPTLANAAVTGTKIRIQVTGASNLVFVKSTETNKYSSGIVISGTIVKVMNMNKTQTYGTHTITDADFLDGPNGGTKEIVVTVPTWTNGSQYKVVCSNLPDILGKEQEYTIKYSAYQYTDEDHGGGLATNIVGVTNTIASYLDFSGEILCVNVRDAADNAVPFATVQAQLLDSNSKVLATLKEDTDARGNAYFQSKSSMNKYAITVTSLGNSPISEHTDTILATPNLSLLKDNLFKLSETVPAANVSIDVKSDTGSSIKIKAGETYQFRIAASSKPIFVCGNSSVFQVAYSGYNGINYFFKATAVGKSGQASGFYINGEKKPRTIATIS